jgi:hypothetical protein
MTAATITPAESDWHRTDRGQPRLLRPTLPDAACPDRQPPTTRLTEINVFET